MNFIKRKPSPKREIKRKKPGEKEHISGKLKSRFGEVLFYFNRSGDKSYNRMVTTKGLYYEIFGKWVPVSRLPEFSFPKHLGNKSYQLPNGGIFVSKRDPMKLSDLLKLGEHITGAGLAPDGGIKFTTSVKDFPSAAASMYLQIDKGHIVYIGEAKIVGKIGDKYYG